MKNILILLPELWNTFKFFVWKFKIKMRFSSLRIEFLKNETFLELQTLFALLGLLAGGSGPSFQYTTGPGGPGHYQVLNFCPFTILVILTMFWPILCNKKCITMFIFEIRENCKGHKESKTKKILCFGLFGTVFENL